MYRHFTKKDFEKNEFLLPHIFNMICHVRNIQILQFMWSDETVDGA